jgi:hypothetical protein
MREPAEAENYLNMVMVGEDAQTCSTEAENYLIMVMVGVMLMQLVRKGGHFRRSTRGRSTFILFR